MVRLTPAEHDVMLGYMRGEIAKQIAARRGTSKRTIDVQTLKLKKKLGARTLAHAAVIYERIQRGQQHDRP